MGGLAIGIVGDAGVRANAQQPRLFVGMILILIFAEALGLYGLIVGLVVASGADKAADAKLCTHTLASEQKEQARELDDFQGAKPEIASSFIEHSIRFQAVSHKH